MRLLKSTRGGRRSDYAVFEALDYAGGTMAHIKLGGLMSWQDRLELQLPHGEAMLVLATRPGNGPVADHPVESSQ